MEKSKITLRTWIVTMRLFIDLPLTDFSNEKMDRDRMSCLVKNFEWWETINKCSKVENVTKKTCWTGRCDVT